MIPPKHLLVLCLFCGLIFVFSSIYAPPWKDAFSVSQSVEAPGAMDYCNHCLVPDVFRGTLTDLGDEDRVTLVVHASFDRVGERTALQVNNWQGPVSLCVVFPSAADEESAQRFVSCTLQKLRILRQAHPNVERHLSVHFLFPRARHNCSGADFLVSEELFSAQNYSEEPFPGRTFEGSIEAVTSYPINVARNAARRMAKTRFVLIADLDHLFSAHFEKKMAPLAKRKLSENPKLALVYRIFEVERDVEKLPETKADLLGLFEDGKAAVFHRHYHAHRIPLLEEWLQSNETTTEDVPSVQFVRPYLDFAWEPQFVALKTIPEHDESFLYPVRDNTVLRWEMCRAGFEFAVVHDVFMFHLGVKTKTETEFVKAAQRRVDKRSQRALREFVKRMRRQYPASEKKCPVFRL
ncbi:hypothetical protein QR680_013265 [Steinernema hermaphroditum]|uniref:N-acetyllactosaminide beta-1,3-N-acetylglucosaminyltransferase n=1 Tax=Steinernema hermaphroditum TaxID=289476 RepID=A0AA39I7Q6_9BILA|nr:hypothetical protein QR680_013265 [Steinernema hermaphroditum]